MLIAHRQPIAILPGSKACRQAHGRSAGFRVCCQAYSCFCLAESAAKTIAVAIAAAAAQQQDEPQAAIAAAAAVVAAEESIAAAAAAAHQDNQPDQRGAPSVVIAFTSTSTVCSS